MGYNSHTEESTHFKYTIACIVVVCSRDCATFTTKQRGSIFIPIKETAYPSAVNPVNFLSWGKKKKNGDPRGLEHLTAWLKEINEMYQSLQHSGRSPARTLIPCTPSKVQDEMMQKQAKGLGAIRKWARWADPLQACPRGSGACPRGMSHEPCPLPNSTEYQKKKKSGIQSKSTRLKTSAFGDTF